MREISCSSWESTKIQLQSLQTRHYINWAILASFPSPAQFRDQVTISSISVLINSWCKNPSIHFVGVQQCIKIHHSMHCMTPICILNALLHPQLACCFVTALWLPITPCTANNGQEWRTVCKHSSYKSKLLFQKLQRERKNHHSYSRICDTRQDTSSKIGWIFIWKFTYEILNSSENYW